MIALAKALPLSVAATMILSFVLNPYGNYAVFMRVIPAQLSVFEFYWSWPIFAVFTIIGWGFFWLLEIR